MKRLINFLFIMAIGLFAMSCGGNEMDKVIDDLEECVDECVSIVEKAKEDGIETHDIGTELPEDELSKLKKTMKKIGELDVKLIDSEDQLTGAQKKRIEKIKRKMEDALN